jgi:hypothetical protein
VFAGGVAITGVGVDEAGVGVDEVGVGALETAGVGLVGMTVAGAGVETVSGGAAVPIDVNVTTIARPPDKTFLEGRQTVNPGASPPCRHPGWA